jgi:hypothetical protein
MKSGGIDFQSLMHNVRKEVTENSYKLQVNLNK